MGFALKALADHQRGFSDGYYTGKSFVYQGSKYAVVDKLEKAKIYTSRYRAERATAMVFENYIFEVVEVE